MIIVFFMIMISQHTGRILVTFGWRKTSQLNSQLTLFSVLGSPPEGSHQLKCEDVEETFNRYVMRERPQTRHKPVMDELEKTGKSTPIVTVT